MVSAIITKIFLNHKYFGTISVFAALCSKVENHDYFRIFSDQLLKNCQEFLADLKILAPKYFPRIIYLYHTWIIQENRYTKALPSMYAVASMTG